MFVFTRHISHFKYIDWEELVVATIRVKATLPLSAITFYSLS